MIKSDDKYIYTTPDGGITMYRNEVGDYSTKVRIGNERVIAGDKIPWKDKDNDYRD